MLYQSQKGLSMLLSYPFNGILFLLILYFKFAHCPFDISLVALGSLALVALSSFSQDDLLVRHDDLE